MQAMGVILGYVGFDGESATQGEPALSWIESLLTSVPGVIMALSALLMLLYPVTKEKFDEIMKALEKRRSGAKLDKSDYPIKK
jgi:Na+/melibiose symporter-like transporter